MPVFEINGKKYDVQDQYIGQFKEKYPDALTAMEHQGKKWMVKASDYDAFVAKHPQQDFWSMQAPYEEPSAEELQALKQEEEDKYVIGFKAGAKQGWKGMKAGVQYLAGETANLVTGTSRDDAMAYDELSRRIENGEPITEENRPWLKRKADKWLSNHPLTPPALREAAAGRVEQDEINLIINQALEDADGDIDKARRIIAKQKILDISWGDKMMEDAAAKMNEMKPTKGFGAWAGNLLPQLIPSGAALAATVITKNPKFATMIGKVGVGAMTAATVGQSMKEARDAGASDSEVWTSGIADGVIEYATEKIPLDRYTRKLFSNTKSKMGAELAEAVADGSSPARKELEQLLKEANKRMGGKLLNGKNVKDLAADMLAEGSSEFLAEAMQTITPILYENPENYPTFTEILSNGWEGAKAGIFMGSVLGGASKAAEHKMQRNRRKQQGYVDIAQAKDEKGQSDIVEIVGLNMQNGNYIVLRDGETSEVAPDNIEQSYRFSFDEFERGVFQSQSDDAYDNGYSLETSQELNDAKNMLEVQEEEIRRLYHLAEDEDVDEFLGDDPIEGIMLSRKAGASEEEQQAKLDYINAKATYDGMLQRMRDDIESQVEANNQRIDQLVNRDTKMVVPAKMKQDDRPVYIVGGNVVLHDDGSVNNSESTQDIIIYDEAKGGYEFTSPSAILEVGQSSSAEELRATQASQIAEQYATTKGDQIDGVLPFAQGDTYNILGEDGVQHTAQIIADNGDGSVQVAMDGATEAAVMPKQQVQAMSQAYNKARAVAYNEQKKAKEVAQQETQAEQTAVEDQGQIQPPVREVPKQKDGTPDYNAMDADMFTEQYVSQFGEDITETVARNNIKEADKKIVSIKKQIESITDPNKLPALYAQLKEAEAAKTKYTAVVENLGLSEDATEDNASRVQRMKQDATPRIAQMFPDGLPNAEAVILADIATGNKIRWSDKVVNGAVVSKGLGAELGLADSNAERTRRVALIGKDAPTPEEYAEQLRERLDAMGIRYEESELRDKVIDVYSSADTRGKAWEQLEAMSANMQAYQDALDYEEEQMRKAYERGRNEQPQDVDFEQPAPEIPTQEEYEQMAKEFNDEAEYSLSDEVDENGRQFVISPNGELAFGEIDEESGLTPAPILLSEGMITNKATNDGYGLVHIEARHGDQIRKAGYKSVIEFIEEVAKNYEVIKEGNVRDGNNTYLLQITDKHNNTLMIELSGDGTYWNINTAGIFKTSYGKNRKEVYNRHTTAKQPAETIEESRNVEPSGTQTLPSMIPSSTLESSDSKDTTSEPKSQEVAEKILQAEAERRRKYEKLRQNGVNGFKIGDKVLYTPEGRSRKPIEATIHDFEEFGANNPVLDVGLAPVMYETTDWKNISKDGQQALPNQDDVAKSTNPSGNKLVSDERYAELRERLRKKLGGQMNIGIDPEILAIGTEMAVYHLEKGARKFTEYAKAMIADLGDAIRPYLKAFYNGARNLPEVESGEIASDMTPYDEVQQFDVSNFDKPSVDAVATAETVVREAEVEKEVEIAQDRIKKSRVTHSKKEKKSVTSQQPNLFGEPQNVAENGTDENSAADNRGTELGSEELPETQSVGSRTPVQDVAGNRQSERMRLDDGSRESRSGSQYDVTKNYSNEEIGEIVSSVTDIVNGKVVLTGAVTDDIKAICRQYKSGGVAKKGRGILDEYYTDGKIVDAVNMLIAPYFENASAIRVLEPSVGVGNFIEATRGMRTSDVVAFEINDTTARIAKILYPNVDVNLRSFETEFIDDSGNKKPLPKKFNLVIGNPPYGSHRGLYKGLGEESKIARYEDYFVKRSLDVLEDGGVLAMVLPSSWIDRHTKYGGYTIEAAYRLPSGAFEATQVGTDIVVLKKDRTVPTSEHSSYFEQHPDRILGEVKQRKSRYGKMEDYVEGNIDAALEAIERDHAKQLAARLDVDETSDNLNDIQTAIEETGSVDNAEAIVKNAQEEAITTKDEQTPIEEAAAQSKYKVNLNRSAETAPTSAQFTHEFSEGEIEAFEDTNYDGTINDPTTHAKYANFVGERYVHDFYYAEGDIYAKLAQLEDDRDKIIRRYGVEQYEKQKRLLESVLPKRKGLDEITISPNTAFVKNLTITHESGRESLKNLFEAFCRKLPYRVFGDSTQWEVIGYINNEQVYGQDKQRNQLIRERRKRMANELFVKFLNEELSDDGKRQVVAAFNREYNSVYRPDYSKVPMFSTINKDFKGKPLKLTSVQLAGIGRMTVKGVGVLAHEVGFGKTLSGILAMHEAMTRGFATKPLIVVPNDNILKQWVETMKEVLPESTVNVLGNLGANYDLTGFKVNDGEFTIVTYEGLKAMSFSDDTYNRLAEKFSYITEDLNKHQSERDYQKEIEKKNELKGKMKRGVKTSYGFEDFGFDWLTVDEVHNANHIVSKVRLDKSIASDFRSQSQRTSDLGLKTWLAAQYIQEENDGRNVLLLSATPFTNKPLEYYSILSLVANDMLRRKGFFNVDQFFATFMEADNELEIAANGRPVQKTNVRRFRNNGLFQQLLSEFIDIKGEEDNPDLVRPTRQNKEYKIAQNDLTAEAMAEVQDLLSDNEKVLQGIGHARAAAFSPYATSLIGRRPKNHKEFVKNSPKIDATIKLIEQNKKDRPDAGQIIYSEVGVEFFPMIRDYLVHESGFKSNEVRIITGATSNNERVNIQTAFNKGEVKVVIGSPAIKEGLNLQENTTDMYILSLPWNFTQLRQIEGRGWRQGNKWENIRINYMLTNDSVDVFMLQRLQLKQGLYNEAMKSGAESLDVSDIDTAELKTQLITDPVVRAEIVTVQEREKLQQEKTRIEADLSFVTRKFDEYNKLLYGLNRETEDLEHFRGYAKNESSPDGFWRRRVKEQEKRVRKVENDIEREKEDLRKKGVNIDDIDRQVRQSQAAIGAIQKRIEGLDDFQQELTEKYIREDRAKAAEQGHNLSAYIKERKKENQSGFYKIRPKDEGVRFRVIDSKKPFDELEERYEKIDKNNAEALNAWRDEKAAVIQSVGTAIADDLGFEPPILVFNGANEESLQEAYNHYKNLYAELGMDEPYSYEAFSEKVNKKDVLGVYWPMIDIITSNTANYDYITDYKQVRGTLLHENAHRVIRSAYTETDLESIWEEAISAQHPVAMMVDRVYGKKSNAGKGNELLAKIIGYIARDRADELSAYIKGGKEIEEKLLNKAGYSLPLGKFALSEILNTFRDDYKRRGDQNLRGGTLGVRGISRGHAASRIRRRAVKEAAELFASQLNTPIRIVEDVNTITDDNAKLQERKRKAKGYFDPKTGEVVVVLPNATSVEDVRETIFHELVGHKGLRELVGKERFNAFLDKVFANASEEVRERIARRAAKIGWDFREATEEYIAEQAEQGFEDRENRNFFEVVRDLFLDMLSKAKIALGYRINDNDLRYMLWRTYQMQRSKGAMAVAEDMVMQQTLGVGNFRARQVSEEEQIATKAKKNGSYLKAPNGKDTNLTPEQWVTVRTKAFKRWFGDWGKAARIEKLRTSESASIVGNEIESSDDMKQYRKNALEYGKSLRGEYRNADTGRTIIINRDSLTEVLHHDGNNVAHIQSIAAIPQMVERGIFITSEPVSADASEKLKNAKEVQYYVCGLNIGGVPYTVKFVVAEYENGERYYDHSLTQIEKGDLLNRAELSSTVADSKSPISGIKDKRLVSILQTNSSKILDANGEPLVVEHSTWNEDFHTFDISKLGESSGDNGIYGSGFYFGNVGETEMYGDRSIKSYLNIKNPFILPEDDTLQFFDYLVDNFDKVGLRDVVVTNSGKSSTIGAIIDAIKEVKANHSRGEYNELIKAMGQYWTPSSAEDRVIEQTIFRKVGFAFYRSLTSFIEHNIGQSEFSEALKSAGYDGIVYDNHEYIAFYPNQIKLADGSNTTFDPNNDDIRFRDGSSTPAPAASRTSAKDIYNHAVRRPNKSGSVKATHNLDFRLREAYQDSMLALKELQNAILKETGKTMRDWEDAYTAQNHMSSKNKAEAEAYKNNFFKPLMEEVAKLTTKGTTYEDVTRYLIAKHGLERNRVFSERDAKRAGKVWDGTIARDYSGLTDLTGEAENYTEAAEAIVKDFEKKHDTGELWKRINAATKNTLKKNYDSGLMSKEDYEHVRDMFKYYIPLRGWNVDVASDEFEYLTSNRPLLSPSLKAAKGRLSLADDPLATIGYMADSAIIQGNRNGMKIRFLNFVLNNPTSLATVNRRWVVEQADGTWRYDDPIIPEDATADEVDAIVKAHNEKMRSLGDKATQKTDGLNLDLRASKQEGQEHTIRVRRNGVEYLIFINGDPAAAQAINGLTNPDVSESTLRKGATYVKNLMARAFTSQNPAFILANLARDVIWAGTAVRIKEDAAYAKRYKANVTDLLTSNQLPKLIKKYQDGKLNPNNEVERYFMEFILNGGETGYTQINTVDDYKRDIGRMLKEAQNGTPKHKKAWRAVFGSIEFMNRSAEDLTRFAVYMTSRQQGRSITRSVTDAKEITVNFNRKGRGGLGADWINFAYIFSNAAIQSITNFARLTKNHPARTMKAVAKFTMAGFLAPVVSMIAYALLGDDDETYWDIPEWVRRNNIVLPIPGSNGYLTIPLPHELRPFYAIGELAMSVLCGKEEVEDALMEAAKGFTGLIPVDFTGNGGNPIVNLTPTPLQPIAQIIANKDYFGTPIYKKYDHNAGDPAWTKAYRGTNAYLVDATRWLNEITGGDNHKRGKINLNPAIIEHLFESYLGGVGKTLNKVAKTISMIWDEDSRMVRNIPVVSSFIQVPNKLTSNSDMNEKYYDAMDEFKETERILRGYNKDARMGSDEYAEKLNELYESPTFQRYRKMKEYKDAIKELSGRLIDVDPTTRNELETLIMELKVEMLDELEKLEDQADE